MQKILNEILFWEFVVFGTSFLAIACAVEMDVSVETGKKLVAIAAISFLCMILTTILKLVMWFMRPQDKKNGSGQWWQEPPNRSDFPMPSDRHPGVR